jgi:glycosyltransferase involved in cell wall biosynthesis
MSDPKLYSVELHIYPARLEDHESFLRLLKNYQNYSNIQIILHNPSKTFIYDLKEYHALLLPSEYGEGTPKSLLEALSIGLPVFVTQSLYSLMWDDIQQSLHIVDFKSDALISAIINVLRKERLVTHKIDLGKKVVLECCSEEIIAKKYLDIL